MRFESISLDPVPTIPLGDGEQGIAYRGKEWLLLDGDRRTVAALVSLAAFAAALALARTIGLPLRRTQPLYYVFGGFISGNLTVITVVVTIGQLLLSRELTTPNDLMSRIEGTIDYRNEVEEAAGRVAPVEPMGFLRLLFENTRQEAQRAGGMASSPGVDDETRETVEGIVDDVTEHADRILELLRGSEVDTFSVISVTMTTNYARQINHLRRVRDDHGDELPEALAASLDDLIDRFQHVDIARQYFKGVYLQEELAELSRLLFYVGVPVLLALVGTLLLFTDPVGATVPVRYLPVVLAAGVACGLAPLSILFAFILRIATVTQRTAATLPFTTPAQEQ